MLRAISKVLFWTYSRGSWQYDVVCGLILCFIFLTPASVFDGSAFRSGRKPAEKPAQTTAPAVPGSGQDGESGGEKAGRP